MDRKKLMTELKAFARSLRHGLGRTQVVLFGSWAEKKETKDSDVDLIIVSKRFQNMNAIERSARMYDYWDLLVPVDFLCYTPSEFNRLKTGITIVNHALKHGMTL